MKINELLRNSKEFNDSRGLPAPPSDFADGNVRSAAELVQSLELTGADGVMTAEGALDDPSIFGKAAAHVQSERELMDMEEQASH